VTLAYLHIQPTWGTIYADSDSDSDLWFSLIHEEII